MEMKFEVPVFARCKARGSEKSRLAIGTLPLAVELVEIEAAAAPCAFQVKLETDEEAVSYLRYGGHLYLDLTEPTFDDEEDEDERDALLRDEDVIFGSNTRMIDALYEPSMAALAAGLRNSGALDIYPEKAAKAFKSRNNAKQLFRLNRAGLSEIDEAQVERCLDIFRAHAAETLISIGGIPHVRVPEPVLSVAHRYGTVEIAPVSRFTGRFLPFDCDLHGDTPPFAYFPIDALEEAERLIGSFGSTDICEPPVILETDPTEFRFDDATLFGIAQNLVEGFALTFTDKGTVEVRDLLIMISPEALAAYRGLSALVAAGDYIQDAAAIEGHVDTVMSLPPKQRVLFHEEGTAELIAAAYRMWQERPIPVSDIAASPAPHR